MRTALLITFAATILAGCTSLETREEVLAEGLRNVKLYVKGHPDLKAIDVDAKYMRYEYDADNSEWQNYWADVRDVADERIRSWQDKVHTLYAFYLVPDGAPGGVDQDAVWVFIDRRTAQVTGHLPTQRGRAAHK